MVGGEVVGGGKKRKTTSSSNHSSRRVRQSGSRKLPACWLRERHPISDSKIEATSNFRFFCDLKQKCCSFEPLSPYVKAPYAVFFLLFVVEGELLMEIPLSQWPSSVQ